MPIWDLFSKRMRRQRGEAPDVYVYDDLPMPLRIQVVHLWTDWDWAKHHPYDFWTTAVKAMQRERGTFRLCKDYPESDFHEFADGFLQEASCELALDYIELSFMLASDRTHGVRLEASVRELNGRLKEHGVGFELLNGQLMRVDSTYLHHEAVKPALVVLHEKRFSGANAEFRRAHEHYRRGRHEEALADCLKSLESVLKVICETRGWATASERLTASKLIGRVFENGLLPSYLQSEFGGVRTILESGVPTVRNRESGHGRGAAKRDVPEYLAAFALHLTAANIVLLAAADSGSREAMS